MKARHVPIFFLALGCVLPGACAQDGLVGGGCREGYAFCADRCIPVTNDDRNCGSCNNACPRSLECIEGVCGGEAIGSGGLGGSASGGFGGESSGGFGGESSGGFGGINVGAGGPGGNEGDGGGSGGASDHCLPPYNHAAACGDCETQCDGELPRCSPDGAGSFECVTGCLNDPYVSECGASCVDSGTDPRHCGDCNNRCSSGICSSGQCVGRTSGHMVALCMSLEQPSQSQTSLLANSVFLGDSTPVRVLAYTRHTSAAAKLGTEFSILSASGLKGRSLELTELGAEDSVEETLDRGDFELFLVYDQEEAPLGELASSGASWRATIDTFAGAGGIVVVLSGGGGVSEMHELIDAIGIFSTSGTNDETGTRAYVQAPGDAVGINIVSPFLNVPTSCSFETNDVPSGELVFVTSDTKPTEGIGAPGVVHRVIVP